MLRADSSMYIMIQLAWTRTYTQPSSSTMSFNQSSETPLCIHLIGTKHLLISHKALQYGGDAHVIDAHGHSRYEPRNKGNQAQRTDDAVQFIAM